MMTALAGKNEMLFRYAVNPGGVTFDIHHRCFIQCIQPTHNQQVTLAPDKIGHRDPDRVGPVWRPGGKYPMFNTGMRGCGGESRTIGPVKPVEDDEMFLAFDVPEAGHIRLIDLNYRLCVRKTALPGASAGILYGEWIVPIGTISKRSGRVMAVHPYSPVQPDPI